MPTGFDLKSYFLMSNKMVFIQMLLIGAIVLGVIQIADSYDNWCEDVQDYDQMILSIPPYQKDICGHIDEVLSTKEGVRVIKGMLRNSRVGSPFMHACILPVNGSVESFMASVLKLSDDEWLSAKHKVNTGNPFDDMFSDKTKIENATSCIAGCEYNSWQKPDGFVKYTLNRVDSIAIISKRYMLITTLLFCLYLIGRIFFKEPNLGWRRLSIVAACIMGGIVPTLYYFDDGVEVPEAFFLFLIAGTCTFTVMLLGRRIYFWVQAGFINTGHRGKALEVVREQEPLILEEDVQDNTEVLPLFGEVEEAQVESLPKKPTQPSSVVKANAKPSTIWILRHWNGDFSLALTFWVTSLMGAAFSTILMVLVNAYPFQGESLYLVSITGVITLLIAILIWLWSLVGVWRSADKHIGRGGSIGWATAAKFSVILGFISMYGTLINNVVPQMKTLTWVLTGIDHIEKMDANVANDGESVILPHNESHDLTPVKGQYGDFTELVVGEGIHIEVPRSWKFQDDAANKHLNALTEKLIHTAGVPSNSGQNVILVMARTFTSFDAPSASLRLSVRNGRTFSQVAMGEAAKVSKAKMRDEFSPWMKNIKKSMANNFGVKLKTVDYGVTSNKDLVCMFFIAELSMPDGLEINQTYVCPLGERTVKLSTSYRKAEAKQFRPVIDHVWQSLQVK